MRKSRLPPLHPSIVIDERYRLLERRGRGGFGEVWKALDQRSGLAVAIKLFTQTPEKNPLWFWNELAILRSHRLQQIVKLLDEGFWYNMPYLVMELVEGEPFPGTSKENMAEIIERTAKLLDLLRIVHAEGILHNDIKPSNVLVNNEGEPILLDFGVAGDGHVDLQRDQELAQHSGVYTAPERYMGNPPTPQSDLYSVGVMLFEALTGEQPFQPDPGVKTSTRQLRKRYTNEKAPSIRSIIPSLPRHIYRSIERLLEKGPGARPRSAADLAETLRGITPVPIKTAEWLASFGIDVGSEEPVSAEHLLPLFAGMERLFHEPSRAAAEMHRRTQGQPQCIDEDVSLLLYRGAWFEGNRLRVGKLLLQSEPPAPKVKKSKQTPTECVKRAYQWIEQGPLDRALQELMQAIWDIRNRRMNQAAFFSAYEKILSAWTDIALAEGTKRVLGPLQFELNRAPSTPLIQQLNQLVSAVAAIAVGGPKPLDILNRLTPFEDFRLELRRQGVRTTACRRLDMNIIQQTFDSLDQWLRMHINNDLAWIRYQSWLGWYYYSHNQFSSAAHAHIVSSLFETWPIAKASSLISAASALMETTEDTFQAVLLAQQGLQQIQLCESPYMEARAEWVIRTALYRNEESIVPDEELIDAVQRLVGTPDIEAQVYLTEAAVAYRVHNQKRAIELAQRAANLWQGAGSLRNQDLASTFAWAMGGPPLHSDQVQAIIQRAITCPVPTIALQTLAFLQQATPGQNVVSQAVAAPLRDKIDLRNWNRRMDILSVHEAWARLI